MDDGERTKIVNDIVRRVVGSLLMYLSSGAIIAVAVRLALLGFKLGDASFYALAVFCAVAGSFGMWAGGRVMAGKPPLFARNTIPQP